MDCRLHDLEPPPGRVLVVMPNWFGDTLFATPVLRAVREHVRDGWVAAVGVPRCREVLEGNPHVDELLIYDERGAHRGLRAKLNWAAHLRRQRFDAAFILRRSLSRTLLLVWAGVRQRVGYAYPKSGWLLTRRVPRPDHPVHRAAYYLRLVESVGWPSSRRQCEFVIGAEDHACADRLLAARLPGEHTGPVVVLNPGANWLHKRWPAERFAALGDRCVEELGAAIVVTGGAQDVALAAGIVERMRPGAISLAGETTLKQVAAVFRRAEVVVANDSGPMHIAASVGARVVALFGPTSPELTGPFGAPQAIVLHDPRSCPRIPCYEPDHPDFPGMRALSVGRVFSAVAAALHDQGERGDEVMRDQHERGDGVMGTQPDQNNR